MIPDDVATEILRLCTVEKWPPGTIASQLGIHHSVVRRVLGSQAATAAMVRTRPTLIEPFLPFITQTLDKYPRLPASRLYQMVKERGYPGAPDHFRSMIARLRPRRPAEAYFRLRTLPAEQAQVDWADFGTIAVDGGVRRLFLFLLVLSYSRKLFMRFFLNAAMGSFVQGHVQAFTALEGVPREILYDNLKSAVIERVGDAIRFHPTMLELSSHYHFLPKPVAVARGNEKGRVERMVGYVRTSFFPARSYQGIDDLNAQAEQWLQAVADQRPCPEDRTRTVAEVFAQEQPSLLPLPQEPFPAEQRTVVAVGRTPYARFDLNDYSVPHDRVRRMLTVLASPDTVRIMDAGKLVATHKRCWGRGKQVEDPGHLQLLSDAKHAAREHRGMDRLHHACPSCRAFFKLVAERGGNLGATTVGLIRLLDSFGAQALDSALSIANERGTAHLGALRHILDQDWHARHQPPPVHLELPEHVRRRSRAVRAHPLSSYDSIRRSDDDDIQT